MINKLISTLKGLLNGTAQDALEKNDIALLSQQIRNAGSDVRSARKAVALASAQNEQDRGRIDRIEGSITDLEKRTGSAIVKGMDTLARDGAEAIAVLEDEREALTASMVAFETDIRSLKDNMRRAEARMRELERGQRTAVVQEKVHSAGSLAGTSDQTSLVDAEETLARIRNRQERGALADTALASLAVMERPRDLVARLAEAGCGSPTGSSAESVLARLRAAQPKLIAHD